MIRNKKLMKKNNSLDTNLDKSYPLELATAIALDNVNVEYEDYTGVYNFHSHEGNKHVPDYLVSKYLIEDKNFFLI